MLGQEPDQCLHRLRVKGLSNNDLINPCEAGSGVTQLLGNTDIAKRAWRNLSMQGAHWKVLHFIRDCSLKDLPVI